MNCPIFVVVVSLDTLKESVVEHKFRSKRETLNISTRNRENDFRLSFQCLHTLPKLCGWNFVEIQKKRRNIKIKRISDIKKGMCQLKNETKYKD